MRIPFFLVMCLVAAAAVAQNPVIIGSAYQRGQTSVAPITFSPPQGWIKDEQAATQAGLFAVLVPRGTTLESADRAVTIAFQKKNPNVAELATLDAFFRSDIGSTLARFPDVQAVRWQPSGINPDKIKFRSLEMFGGKTSPHRTLIIEASDGFFSITATAETRKDLEAPEYEAFFNSIKLP
ncbi:MAG: hypothetical protein JWN02_315 [Acidobacteria bacterium]|nr:hypothetical protein [Acidobacteriota bacterium]